MSRFAGNRTYQAPLIRRLAGNRTYRDALWPVVARPHFLPFLWRAASWMFPPVTYAEAILVADAVVWEGAPTALVGQLRGENVDHMLVRACLFRLYTAAVGWPQMKERLS